ncbi:hypothetical protein BROUX41_003717 [Berkeleyomyces rouxiae]
MKVDSNTYFIMACNSRQARTRKTELGRVRTLRGDSAPSTPGERVSAINAATGVAGAPFETLALESFKCSPE